MKKWARKIADMVYETPLDEGLNYASPVRGAWNIVHIGTLVPQSHQIFVCPTSCLRGVVLTTAELGAMDRLSTIAVGEDNILEGDMEERLYLGTKRVLDALPERPRMVMVFTSCIHHFMAVNYQRIYKILRKEYPEIDFIDAYMDPIMRKKTPPIPCLFRQMHRVWQKGEKKAGHASFLAMMFPLTEHCDLYAHLVKNNITVHQLPLLKDYDSFKAMANSQVNFIFHKYSLLAAKDVSLRLDTPYLMMRGTYDYDEIDADMAQACRALGIPEVSKEQIEEERRLTEEAVEAVRKQLGDTPVAIDYTAVDQPLNLALYLLRHGFNVETVFLDTINEDRSVFEALQKEKGDLEISAASNWNMRAMDRHHEGKIVAIGQKAAYFNDTDYFIDIVDQAGLYGYRGIRELMRLLAEANAETKNMKELVSIKGWGCCA